MTVVDELSWNEKSELLVKLIARHNEEKSQESFVAVLQRLKDVKVWVPVQMELSDADVNSLLNTKKEDAVGGSSQAPFRPAVLQTSSGEKMYAAFTSREEAGEGFNAQVSWMNLPFKQYALMVLNHLEVQKIVINAFTKNLIVADHFLRMITNTDVAARPVEQDIQLDMKSLEGSEEVALLKKIATDWCQQSTQVVKAYMAKMSNQGQESYLFVVDAPGVNPQQMFSALDVKLRVARRSIPIDFVVYPTLKEQLEAIGCEPFYQKEVLS